MRCGGRYIWAQTALSRRCSNGSAPIGLCTRFRCSNVGRRREHCRIMPCSIRTVIAPWRLPTAVGATACGRLEPISRWAGWRSAGRCTNTQALEVRCAMGDLTLFYCAHKQLLKIFRKSINNNRFVGAYGRPPEVILWLQNSTISLRSSIEPLPATSWQSQSMLCMKNTPRRGLSSPTFLMSYLLLA